MRHNPALLPAIIGLVQPRSSAQLPTIGLRLYFAGQFRAFPLGALSLARFAQWKGSLESMNRLKQPPTNQLRPSFGRSWSNCPVLRSLAAGKSVSFALGQPN